MLWGIALEVCVPNLVKSKFVYELVDRSDTGRFYRTNNTVNKMNTETHAKNVLINCIVKRIDAIFLFHLPTVNSLRSNRYLIYLAWN